MISPRSPTVLLAFALGAGLGRAQAPNRCEVERNNGPCFGTSTVMSMTTGRAFNHEVYQPPGYLAAPGVAASDEVWRWVPSAVDQRFETREISGYSVWLRPSASTLSFPMTGYIPDMTVYAAQPRPGGGGGFQPDPTQNPLLAVAGASVPLFSPDAHRITSSFGAALPVTTPEMCMSLRFVGGEHRNLDGGQGLVGTVPEAPWPVSTWGTMTAAGAVTVVDPVAIVGEYTTPWMSWFETAPVVVAHSNFASNRIEFCAGLRTTGFNDGAGQSDLVTQPVDIGWNVDAGTMWPGAWCAPLANLAGSPSVAGTPAFGLTFELDLANPLLAALSSYGGAADASGYFSGPRLPFAAVGPALLGTHFGVEFVVFDASLSTLVGSTQAHWIRIQ